MTTDARHSKQTISNGGVHSFVALEYADAATRLAATGFDSYDLYKVAIDLDTSDLNILVDTSPITWVFFGSSSSLLNKVRIACRKSTAGTLTKGTVVYGVDYNDVGNYAEVEAAKADSATTLPAVGLIEVDCTDSVTGYLMIVGVLHSVDTSSWSAQDPLYVSESTAGQLRNTSPSGPYVSQAIGVVLDSDASEGHIGVNVQGYRAIHYTSVPEDLGTAAAGTSNESSASDHVHNMPDAADVGAAPSPHAIGGSDHSSDTLANLNTKISDATLDDSGDPRDPNAHSSSHENGGSDEISVAGLSGTLADPQTPTAHASTHQHGGADEVATATPAANAIPKADGSGKLNSWVDTTALTSTAPVNVTKAAAAVGVGTTAARHDHKHDVTTAAPSGTAVRVGNSAAEGSATTLARSDHTHTVTGGTPVNVTKAANAAGSAVTFARSDHKHDVSTAAPGATGVATASGEGSATTLARSDHTHQSNTAPSDVTKAAATIGTSGQPARADHKHDITTATASAQVPGDSAAEGVATTLARSDHKHSLPAYGTGAGTICQGNDSRLSDARTPTAHASSHQHGGSDEIATATPAANAIPKADGSGKLNSWVDADVVGPASATDEAFARYDTTTGKLLQNSSTRQNDSGNVGIIVTPSATNPLRVTGVELPDFGVNVGATATYNDYDVNDYTNFSFHSATGNFEITGLASPVQGKLVVIHNTTDYTCTIRHEDTGSLSGNRFDLPNDTDVALPPNGAVSVTYCVQGGSSRWRVTSSVGGGGGESYATTVSSWTSSGGRYYADVTHNLGTEDVFVASYRASSGETVLLHDVDRTSVNVVRVWVAVQETLRILVTVGGGAGVGSGVDTTAIHTDESAEISTVTEKTTPVSADLLIIEDSAAGNVKKKVQIGNLPVTGSLGVKRLFADQFISVTGTDWFVDTGAPLLPDVDNSAILVRAFDPSTDEGVGFTLDVPAGATQIRFTTRARARTAQTANALLMFARREIPDNAAIGSWAGYSIHTVAIPNNTYYQKDTTQNTLATFGLTAGKFYQCQLYRDADAAGDTLTVDLDACYMEIEFT